MLLAFEGGKKVVPSPMETSMPPLDIRDGQNFSKYGITVYDPTTSRAAPWQITAFQA